MKIPIVIIGGGTGTSVLLHGLRRYPVDPTVIISTADSGGSSGTLRRELGVNPVGDIRQCLLSLSQLPKEERALWNYRFGHGQLKGHSIGNLLLAALADMHGNMEKALAIAKKIWKIHGTIIPMTEKPTTLCARYRDGTLVCDEHSIDEPERLHGGIAKVYLREREPLYAKAAAALKKAKLILFAPGDLYTSILPPLLTRDVATALRGARAPIVYVANLMTSRGETDGFTLSTFVKILDHHLRPRSLDTIIVNTTPLPASALKWYRQFGEVPIHPDFTSSILKTKIIVRAPLLSGGKERTMKGDGLRRSLIRHDPQKLARCIMRILQGH